MAELLPQYDGLPEYDRDEYDNFSEFAEEERAAFEELEESEDLIYFPRADGSAIYLIESIDPPRLRHVPYMDGYAIPAAHVRGLRSQDIRKRIPEDD